VERLGVEGSVATQLSFDRSELAGLYADWQAANLVAAALIKRSRRAAVAPVSEIMEAEEQANA
jgi:hypothetical protein